MIEVSEKERFPAIAVPDADDQARFASCIHPEEELEEDACLTAVVVQICILMSLSFFFYLWGPTFLKDVGERRSGDGNCVWYVHTRAIGSCRF